MKRRNRIAALIVAAGLLSGAISAALIINAGKAPDDTADEDLLYTVDFRRVGGSDEAPLYEYEFTWLGEEPLVIDSEGWHIGEG